MDNVEVSEWRVKPRIMEGFYDKINITRITKDLDPQYAIINHKLYHYTLMVICIYFSCDRV